MKKEEVNGLINPSSESIEKKDEPGLDAMNHVDHGNQKKAKSVLRKTFIISILLILCVGIVYAGVKTMEKKDLNNNQGEVLGNLENEDTDDNYHLDSHMTREELFRYGDELSASQAWANKSFVVIDTEVGYPLGIDMRPHSNFFYDYSDIKIDDNILVFPEQLGDYKFGSLSIHYEADFPDGDTVNAMIEENDKERFIVKEVETGDCRAMSYFYKSGIDDLTMTVKINFEEESLFVGKLEGLEVIKIDDVDVFITASDYMGVTYEPNKTLILKSINHFETTWFESNHKIMINVRPGLKNSDNEFEEEVNGEHILTTTYPENTKESLISFTELLHEALKSIK